MKNISLKKYNKKKGNRNRKAEITTDTTINTILLIIGFVIIIALIGMLVYYTLIKESTCHDSIVMRSSVNNPLVSAARVIPLKCETEKTCLSNNGETCPTLGVASKDNVITKKNIDSNTDKAKQQVLDEIASDLYQCHSMLGEGQLNFMPPTITDKNYCLICSRIVLSDKERQTVGDISYAELYQYLSKKKNNDGKSYLEYLHPDWTDWRSYSLLLKKLQDNSTDPVFKSLRPEQWVMDTGNENGTAIIAQLAPTGYFWSLAKAGGVLVGVGALATGIGAPAGIALIGTGSSAVATFWYTSPGGKFEYSPPEVYPYNIQFLQNMHCSSFETAP